MDIVTSKTDARRRLIDTILPTFNPVLDTSNGPTDDINKILTQIQRATVWAANTVTNIGAVIIPTTGNRNGHRYKCIRLLSGGNQQTGATEPIWPMSRENAVTDGAITWQEDGIEYDLWDLRYGFHLGWKLKLEKAAVGDDDKLFARCEKMLKKYPRVVVL
jgi:hypothetical protein